MALDQYYLLGKSGLRVSRLALGTMNFGTAGFHAAYGKTRDEARPILRAYLDAGGNFVDTADFYTAGQSEIIIGDLLAEAGVRDRVVLTTKFTNTLDPSDPNAGGNGRKHMIKAVEDSLRRLRTDYIDLFLLHIWDRMTPAEEVVRTFDDLVRAGKIRYAGLSDVPSWYAARAQTYAEAHNLTPMIGLQLPYSLVAREIELEYVSLARNLGMGITGFGPVAGGLLSGKYRPSENGLSGDGRLIDSPGYRPVGEREWQIIAAVEKVADGLGRSMAQVAINWVATRPGVAAALIGASGATQVTSNIGALDFEIPADARALLDEASAPAVPGPYALFQPAAQAQFVGRNVGDKPTGYSPPLWVS
ncbi:aldo/keto reductase [Kibdelosporangium persicum]|uniref:Oxidoreductase n=1 Tax=Kibdelosporangium persicum TaxID=2698649 RepID=A0ABX2FBU1_9PSEU|nr:aldo/keto reductase [Kibdelosporangium persicum]NRN68854.1 putative oxidoreductase [Kibdelosporangium persicum]